MADGLGFLEDVEDLGDLGGGDLLLFLSRL